MRVEAYPPRFSMRFIPRDAVKGDLINYASGLAYEVDVEEWGRQVKLNGEQEGEIARNEDWVDRQLKDLADRRGLSFVRGRVVGKEFKPGIGTYTFKPNYNNYK